MSLQIFPDGLTEQFRLFAAYDGRVTTEPLPGERIKFHFVHMHIHTQRDFD